MLPLGLLSSPEAILAAEVAGVLAGALLVGGLIARAATPSARVAGAVAMLLGLLVLPALWSASAGLGSGRGHLKVDITDPSIRADEKCFIDPGRGGLVPFLRWVRRQVPEDWEVGLTGPVDRPCWQLNLLPRLLAAPAARPRWTIVVGPLPPGTAPADVRTFAPGQALVRAGS